MKSHKSYYQSSNNGDQKSSFIENEDIDIKDIWSGIVRKRNWAYTSGSILFIATIFFTIHQRIFNPLYIGNFSMLIRDPLASKNDPRSGNRNGGIGYYESISSQTLKYDLDTLERYLRSRNFLKDLAKKHNISPGALSGSIKISRTSNMGRFGSGSQGVLDIQYTTKNLKRGSKVINDLADIYLKESLIRKQQKLKDGLNFLKKQAPSIKKEESLLENKLVNFREKYKLIDPITEGQNLKGEEKKLKEIILNLKTEISRLTNVRKEIKNGTLSARGFEEELGNGLSVTDFDQGLLSQLISVEKEIAIAKSKFTSKSSIVKGLESRLKQIQPALLTSQLEAVDIALSLNKARLENTKTIFEETQNDFQKLPIIIKEFQEIQQDLSFANKNLIDLKTTINSFELELAQTTIPWKIISNPSMLRKPISPSIKKNLQLGLLFSFLFGLAIALLRDRFDHVFNSPEDVTKTLKSPLIGTFPFINKFSNLRSEDLSIFDLIEQLESERTKNQQTQYIYQSFAFTESLRNIFTSIKFSNSERRIKTLLITSSIPKEGKSLFNILLGKIISEMGEKVLIIDCDMRKPSIHKKLNIDNILGLSNYLSDENIVLDQVIQSLKNLPNLSCITSGNIPPDPTRLLSSKRFDNLLENLKNKNEFDLILIDSPPILGLADSLILSKAVDGSILLVSLNYIDRSLPKESIKSLRLNKNNFLGIISNSIKQNITSNLYGYQYKYGNYSYTYSNYLPLSSDKENEESEKDTRKNIGKFNNPKINNFISNANNLKNKILKWLDN